MSLTSNLRQFSIYPRPGSSHLMGTLKGYFDDSGDEPDPNCNCVVYGGYVGPLEEWDRFEIGWRKALERADVPYLHMKELMGIHRSQKEDSPYFKWIEDRAAINLFLVDLATEVRKTALRPIVSAVDKRALADLNSKHGLTGSKALDAEAIAIYACCWLSQANFGEHVLLEFVVDKTTKHNSLRNKVIEISENENRDVPIEDHITINFLPKDATSRHVSDKKQNVYSLQLADFLAWESHRFTKNRIINNGEINVSLTRKPCSILFEALGDHSSMFLNDLALTSWDEQKKGAWPNTPRGLMVKSWKEFWETVAERCPRIG